MLIKDQKKSRLDISKYLLSLCEDDPEELMHRVVTQDETWDCLFDPEAKEQSMQWKHLGSPSPKKCKVVSSAGNVIASIFWHSQDVIMMDYLEECSTIKSAYYAEELRWLRQEIVKKKRSKLTQGALLLHDNASVHTSQVAMAAATKCSFVVLPHLLYLPLWIPVSKSENMVGILEAMKVS